MKIAIVTDSFPPYLSGVSTYTVELCRQLTKRGHKVLLFVPDNPGENLTPKGLEKVKIIRMKSVRTMIKGFRISVPNTGVVISELRKFKADLIETENPIFLGLDGLISSKILGIPCVSVFHTLATSKEYLELIFKTKSSLLERASWLYHQKFYGNSNKVFVFTGDVFKLLVKQGVDINKIEIVPTFFDYYNVKLLDKNAKKALKKYYGLKEKVAVYLGRVSPEKNLNVLVRIWKDVVRSQPNSSLLIIGSGLFEKKLKNLVLKEKLDGNVKILGAIEHEQLMEGGLLSTCDVFVSASKSETFGLTGIEAMAHKLPVILFKTQGLAEIVDSGGIICKQNDTNGFKNAILELFENDKKRLAMGTKAREIARQFDSQTAVDKLINKYEDIVASYKPSKVSIKYLSETKINLNINKYKKSLKLLIDSLR